MNPGCASVTLRLRVPLTWTPPHDLDPRPAEQRRRPLIASLAVDVEPVVFWDGTEPSWAELLERWTSRIGFDPDRHGQVRPQHNGPSGAGVIDRVLAPLGLPTGQVAFTDAVPWFFVKTGKGSQGEAIADETAGHQDRLAPDGYGSVGSLRIGTRRSVFLPLAHPGFVRRTTRPDWRHALDRFERTAPELLGVGR